MKRHPLICLLVTVCMIASLTGQAAAAFRMACEGTASCCCRPDPATHAMPADMGPMSTGCCAPTPSQPCDLAGPMSVPAILFLPVENNFEPDISLALARLASATVDPNGSGVSDRIPIRPPTPAGPPIYLLIQAFLC